MEQLGWSGLRRSTPPYFERRGSRRTQCSRSPFAAFSPPQAYVVAAHFTRAHCTQPPPPGAPADAPASEPHLPSLLGPVPPPPLPNNSSVPPLEAEGVDLSGGVAAAFPGYDALRLLAPNAELRLLHAGITSMVNPHTMRWAGGPLPVLFVCCHVLLPRAACLLASEVSPACGCRPAGLPAKREP